AQGAEVVADACALPPLFRGAGNEIFAAVAQNGRLDRPDVLLEFRPPDDLPLAAAGQGCERHQNDHLHIRDAGGAEGAVGILADAVAENAADPAAGAVLVRLADGEIEGAAARV